MSCPARCCYPPLQFDESGMSELTQLPWCPPRSEPERHAVADRVLVPGVPQLVVLEGLEAVVELVVAELVDRQGLAALQAGDDVEVVPLPLIGQLVPRDEAHVEPEDGPRKGHDAYGVREVKRQEEGLQPAVAPPHRHDEEAEVQQAAAQTDGHEAPDHEDELPVVQQPDAVREPAAEVIVPSDRRRVEPGLVTALRHWRSVLQGYSLAPLGRGLLELGVGLLAVRTVQLPGVKEDAEGHATHR
mmetsp:Transcript_114937/g.336221  ORF Transcript_114937/g.336221 Transcript_114937/m.336221 type:complete len:244 (+) Transcript_114937:56-787(+)